MSRTATVLLGWTPELSRPDDEPARRSVAAKIGSVSGLKTFPTVAQKVLALLSDPEFTVDAVTQAIREDPALAAGVLRLANSAFFAPPARVLSVDQAFVRLGRNSVEEVLYAVVTMRMFPDAHGFGAFVRDHCAATAAVAHCLASAVAPKSREEMFLAGLMHDIGKMLLLESGEMTYPAELHAVLTEKDECHGRETERLGFDHAILAGEVLGRWRIPDPIPKIVSLHHSHLCATQFPEVRERVSLLRAADTLERAVTAQKFSDGPDFELLAGTPELGAIGIDVQGLVSLWPEIERAHAEALRIFKTGA